MAVDEYVTEQDYAFDDTGFIEGLFWNQIQNLTKRTMK
jgi:hypothetical protein